MFYVFDGPRNRHLRLYGWVLVRQTKAKAAGLFGWKIEAFGSNPLSGQFLISPAACGHLLLSASWNSSLLPKKTSTRLRWPKKTGGARFRCPKKTGHAVQMPWLVATCLYGPRLLINHFAVLHNCWAFEVRSQESVMAFTGIHIVPMALTGIHIVPID
ncbi:hypothetical protein LZ32DRAFT_329948 [Colletotrichum eremochloae]|nr:hypothetical protein LZ32DRAFT_329948 [Colletotrichum eremochloae]